MAVRLDPGGGGFQSIPTSIDPDTPFGRSKLGQELIRRELESGSGAGVSEEDITAARRRIAVQKKLEAERLRRIEEEKSRKEAERLRKIEAAKAKAEAERKRLQELKEKRERASREREEARRRLSQERERRRGTAQAPREIRKGDKPVILPGDPREIEYERKLQAEAKRLKRDLTLAEKEKIAGGIYGFEVVTTGYSPTGVAKREVRAITGKEVPEVKTGKEYKAFGTPDEMLRAIEDTSKKPTIEMLKAIEKEAKKSPRDIKAYSAWRPEYEKEYYKKTPSQVAKEFVSIIVEDVKQLKERELKIRSPFEAFKGAGKRTSEIIAPQTSPTMKLGTIGIGEAPFYTYGELQAKQELEYEIKTRNIMNKYQKQVDEGYEKINKDVQSGVITVEEANKKLRKITEQTNTDLNRELGKIEKVTYYEKGVQTGDVVYGYSKLVPEVASFATPLTAVLMGTYKASEQQRTAPIVIESAEKGVPVYPTTKTTLGQRAEVGLFIGAGGLGGFGSIGKVERSIVADELTRLSQQPFEFRGLTIKGGKKDYTIVSGTQELGGLKTDVVIEGLTERTGKSAFIMPEGAGTAEISGQLSWNVLGGGKPTYIRSLSKFDVGGKGLGFQGTETGKLLIGDEMLLRQIAKGKIQKGISTTTIIPEYSTSMLYQTKKGKLVSPYQVFPDPRIRYDVSEIGSQIKYAKKEFERNIVFGGDVIKSTKTSVSLRLPKNYYFTTTTTGDTGFIKVIYPKKPTDTKFIGKSGKKSSKEYLRSLYKEPISTIETETLRPVSEIATKTTIETLPQTTISTTPFAPVVVVKKEATGLIGLGETRFTGVVPGGRMGELGVGETRFGDLGVAGTRFGDLGLGGTLTGVGELGGVTGRRKPKERTETVKKGVEEEKEIDISKIKSGEDILSKQPSKQKEALRTKQKQKQKQTTAQLQSQLLKQRLAIETGTPVPPPPITFPDLPTALAKVKKVMKEKPRIFEAFVTKFGEEVSIGIFPTKRKARKELIGELTTTIRAGGFITKDKKKLRFGELGITSPAFRPSKIDPFKVIQKKEKRLARPTEAQEIQYFRKKKGLKKKKGLFSL